MNLRFSRFAPLLTFAVMMLGIQSGAWATVWNPGDVVIYVQSDWGASDPSTFAGAALLQSGYSTVYGSAGLLEVGIPGPSGNSMLFDSASAVGSYLPQSGSVTGPLTTDLLDPTSSPAGLFGGLVVSTRLNVDFSDAGLLGGSSGLLFGDLVLTNFDPTLSGLNGLTIRQFLGDVSTLLGGGTSIYDISDLTPVLAEVDDSFYLGDPTSFAQDHIAAPIVASVPEPGSFSLLGAGIFGLVAMRRRKMKAAQ